MCCNNVVYKDLNLTVCENRVLLLNEISHMLVEHAYRILYVRNLEREKKHNESGTRISLFVITYYYFLQMDGSIRYAKRKMKNWFESQRIFVFFISYENDL